MSERRVEGDDYLWDRTGPPDPEVARLEELLGGLRYREGPAPDLSAAPGPQARGPAWLAALAAAAVATVALALVSELPLLRPRGWDLTWMDAGGPRATRHGRLREGERLVTGVDSRARLAVGSIGEVVIEPETSLRLLDAGGRTHRLGLERGTVHATIWAPPRSFVIDTPAAVATDLGCAYTLEVDEAGGGRLSVESGWVGFESRGRESFVPQGAVCLMRPGVGPGTPHWAGVSPAFARALATLDFGADPESRPAALRALLAEAGRRDALSLWHLLARVPVSERPAVYDRLAELVPPPRGVSRGGVVGGDRRMLDLWWDSLGLGSARFWRVWTAPWPPPTR